MNLHERTTGAARPPLDLTRPADLREQACSGAFSEWLRTASVTDLATLAQGLESMAGQIRSEETHRAWRSDPLWANDPYPRGLARSLDANLLEVVA